MDRRTPQGQRRLERAQAALDAIEDLTQAEYQSLRMLAQGRVGKLKTRQNFASRGLLSSAVASRMVLTAKGQRSLEAYEAKKVTKKDLPSKTVRADPEAERQKWLKRHAPAFRRAAP